MRPQLHDSRLETLKSDSQLDETRAELSVYAAKWLKVTTLNSPPILHCEEPCFQGGGNGDFTYAGLIWLIDHFDSSQDAQFDTLSTPEH